MTVWGTGSGAAMNTVTTIPLKQLMADVFECGVGDVDEDARINETVGWDSLSHIRLVLAIEKKFGLRFSASEVGRLKNVGEFAALIESKTA